MSRPSWERLSAHLDELLELPEEQRVAYLATLSGEDMALRPELERLLALAARRGLLDAPAAEALSTLFEEAVDPPAAEVDHVGPWRLVRELGRGGMGVVYLAERADGQYEQRAALKLIKRGLDTDEILARFRRERQILARLEHPAIARLLDGGVATDGRPYLVMEYVEGWPITRYCDDQRRSIVERLRLFRLVCQAVQHAHGSLVIHRDLKPSNILATRDGGLKLLDFGIAKLLGGGDSDEATAWTNLGLRALTPEYAAPEQVRGEPATTATDVYSLGVVLYELLSGRRPYRLPQRLGAEAERLIAEFEPPPPSAVVERELAEGPTAGELAAARRLTPAGLRRALAGDLDAIVATALAKEAGRRYATAQEFAADIERQLSGRSVAARPLGRLDRAARFVRRHRIGVAASLVVLLALVGGLAATAWQARERAREARHAEQIKNFVLEMFAVVDPETSRGEDVSARQLLDEGAGRIQRELGGQPLVQAELLTVLAGLYQKLGFADEALPLAQRAVVIRRERLDPRSLDLGDSLGLQGTLLSAAGRLDEAERALQEALTIHRAGGGDGSAVAADLEALAAVAAQRRRAEEEERFLSEALAIYRRQLGDAHPKVADVLGRLAFALRQQGRGTEAVRMRAQAVAIEQRRALPEGVEAVETFPEPRVGAHRLDACLHWSADCGEPAATAWCKLQGYDHAVRFEHEYRIGAGATTWVLADERVCDGCDSFAWITCGRGPSEAAIVAALEEERRDLLRTAALQLRALREAPAEQPAAAPARAVEHWLLVTRDSPEYRDVLDRALALVERSAAEESQPLIDRSTACSDLARPVDQGLALCPAFFSVPSQCQREVLVRETLRREGLEGAEGACDGNSAVASAPRVARLVLDLAALPSGTCFTPARGSLLRVATALEWDACSAFLVDGDAGFRFEARMDRASPEPPRSIRAAWRLPWDGVDAALRWSERKAYLFRGAEYARIDLVESRPDPGFPRRIADDWPGLWPDGIDAALPWPNGFAYFFRGSEYTRVALDDPERRTDSTYPRPIGGHWPGLWQDGVEGAVLWDARTAYFFKAGQFMRYAVGPPEGAEPPRPISCCWR